ncbi:hypothetical protein CXY01_30370 [Cellulomonas xylanilytica]|uniref:Uncharacterized protein n=1 Tax=Cellulomonas xylanilytica TaxID=233583 RepID=A0A510V6L5_9CELL|nr:hypothetical protein CXY01_30370 [Cellulomonas xylanilytica]
MGPRRGFGAADVRPAEGVEWRTDRAMARADVEVAVTETCPRAQPSVRWVSDTFGGTCAESRQMRPVTETAVSARGRDGSHQASLRRTGDLCLNLSGSSQTTSL